MPGTVNDNPLTVEDLAEALHYNCVTVREMLDSGGIPGGVKIGKRWYLSRANFDKLLAGER